MFQLSDAV